MPNPNHDPESPQKAGCLTPSCSLLVSDLIAELRSQAEDMRTQPNLGSYADRTEDAADTLEKYLKAIDSIYNHNAAARAAVIQHCGIIQRTIRVRQPRRKSHEKHD